jgi:hypothetical protein
MNPIVEEEPIASSPEQPKKEESPPVQEPPTRYQTGTQFSSTPLPQIMSYAPAAFPPQMEAPGATVFNGSIPTYQQGVSLFESFGRGSSLRKKNQENLDDPFETFSILLFHRKN